MTTMEKSIKKKKTNKKHKKSMRHINIIMMQHKAKKKQPKT